VSLPEQTRTHEGDAVAVVRIHVRLDLEDDAGHGRFRRFDLACGGTLRERRGCVCLERVQHVANAEVLERGAEEHRRERAVAEFLEIEAAAGRVHEIDFLTPAGVCVRLQQLVEQRIVGAGDRLAVGVRVEAADARMIEIIGAAEIAALADGPDHWRGVEGERLLDLVEKVERLAGFAVELVDEGDDRDVAHATDLEQLLGARFDTACGVDHHDGGVDGGQRAIGVVGEVFVARRVEQVEDGAAVFERHDGRDDGDAAGLFDGHPVRARGAAVPLGLDLSGKLDRAAEQQQLFGERRLTGVGMRDDRERAAPADFLGKLALGGGFRGSGFGGAVVRLRRFRQIVVAHLFVRNVVWRAL
jgi:hypothetical protein